MLTINVIGIRQAAIVSNVFTIGKLIPIIIFIAVGLFFLNPQAFAFGARPPRGAFSQSVLLLIYAFTGFEMAVIPAGEVRDPRSNLPRALLIAIGVVAILYILVQIVCVGTLPELAQSQKPLADAGIRFLGAAGAPSFRLGHHFDHRQFKHTRAFRFAASLRDGRAATTAVIHRIGPSKVCHSSRRNPDNRGGNADFRVEEFFCGRTNYQRDREAGNLRRDLPFTSDFPPTR